MQQLGYRHSPSIRYFVSPSSSSPNDFFSLHFFRIYLCSYIYFRWPLRPLPLVPSPPMLDISCSFFCSFFTFMLFTNINLYIPFYFVSFLTFSSPYFYCPSALHPFSVARIHISPILCLPFLSPYFETPIARFRPFKRLSSHFVATSFELAFTSIPRLLFCSLSFFLSLSLPLAVLRLPRFGVLERLSLRKHPHQDVCVTQSGK